MSNHAKKAIPNTFARATYRVTGTHISTVLSHRRGKLSEEYLVLWKSPGRPEDAVCSWHPLDQLALCLHHVQAYIERRAGVLQRQTTTPTSSLTLNPTTTAPVSRKRKSRDDNPLRSRASQDGMLTPQLSHPSREQSVISINSADSVEQPKLLDAPKVYNGILEQRAGKIVAKRSQADHVTNVDATKFPTAQMLKDAAAVPVSGAERMIRSAFIQKLKTVPSVRLENTVDASAPSLDFTFVKRSILRDGVVPAPVEAMEGCQKPCKPNMGQHIGCEYTKLCSCLEYAAVNTEALERQDPDLYERYRELRAANAYIDTTGLPKRFPYEKPKFDSRQPSTLQSFYRENRHPIYECNTNCNCGAVCKSRIVRKGRRVPLTIFKTKNRGWGVKCDEDLIRGEFIDTYLGEVVTNEEADRREAAAGTDKASYLYSLDKFVGDDADLTEDTCYVVDGQYMGGPTRFINHCCEPNCRQYTVSYNKHDLRLYDLAFFAYADIPRGTELTFDYMDKDEEEEVDVLRKRAEAAIDPTNSDKKPCNCGAVKCRGYLWV